MSNGRTVLFLCCIIIWVGLYCSGIIVGTAFYRSQFDPVNGSNDFWFLVFCVIVVFLNYSMSNIAILCCLASLIGGLASLANDVCLVGLLAKGLFVYLLVVSCNLVVGGNDLTSISQSQYIKLATMSSLFSFVIGYFPRRFDKLVSIAGDKVDSIAGGANQEIKPQ